MKALRYEILRAIKADGNQFVLLPEKPVRVATLINEQDFLAGNELQHNRNVFLEDRYHDWDWANGKFTYYSRVALEADVLIVYEMQPECRPARPTGNQPKW